MGLLRKIVPGLDRRGPDRFRDPDVAQAVQTSRATLEDNARLLSELAALQVKIGKVNEHQRRRSASR